VQKDIKRLLAYSAIAHAGYLLVSLVAGAELGGTSTLFYLVVYVLTTLGAFGVVALVRSEDDEGTDLESFSGLAASRPWLAGAMAIFMFSLAGIPPTAGFVGKFYIFAGAVQAGYLWLAVIGVMASLVSIYYYLRVVVIMYMRPGPSGEPRFVPSHPAVSFALVLAIAGIFLFGILPGPLYAAAKAAISGIL
jgi:NADH-quinone oxidoreductase subunit N